MVIQVHFRELAIGRFARGSDGTDVTSTTTLKSVKNINFIKMNVEYKYFIKNALVCVLFIRS